MRLLYVSGTYAPGAFAGAELSAHTMLRCLSRNHDVKVLVATDAKYADGRSGARNYQDVDIIGIRHTERMTRITEAIQSFKPDVIYTQPFWHDIALLLGRKFGIPTILRVVDWPFPIEMLNGKHLAPSAVVVASQEAETQVRRNGHHVLLLPAFIDLERAQSSKPKQRRYATMFNPVEQKGGFVFKSIAERMPERSFAVVPGWFSLRDANGRFDRDLIKRAVESKGERYEGWMPREPDFRALRNVTMLPPRDDIAEILDQTRVLLVPSQWKEQFGRIMFEAAANGAVVIASGMPSIRKNVGDGAHYVDDYGEVDAWVAAVQRFDDPRVYEEQSLRGRAHVLRSYDLNVLAQRFFDLARQLSSVSNE